MKYLVKQKIQSIYHEGKRYPVIDGLVDIPGTVDWLEPAEKALSDFTVKELRELCKEKEIKIPADKTSKDDLIALLATDK